MIPSGYLLWMQAFHFLLKGSGPIYRLLILMEEEEVATKGRDTDFQS